MTSTSYKFHNYMMGRPTWDCRQSVTWLCWLFYFFIAAYVTVPPPLCRWHPTVFLSQFTRPIST